MKQTKTTYHQGGDAQAISEIAKKYYGSFRNMFEMHQWPETQGDRMMAKAQTYIVKDYGSIAEFEESHQKKDDLMFPIEAITQDPPNVWLTSTHGFGPSGWGLYGFTIQSDRDNFINKSQAGVLVVIYGTKGNKTRKEEQGKVLGILQCSHIIGHAKGFMSDDAWRDKENDGNADKWNFGVKVEHAWRVIDDDRPLIDDFAHLSYSHNDAQTISKSGKQLTKEEALKILKLKMVKVPVFGGSIVEKNDNSQNAKQFFCPSKAGPVSQNAYFVKESEGPKYLYIMKLKGDKENFIGRNTGNEEVIKVGFSGNIQNRLRQLNAGFPLDCAYSWEIMHLNEEVYPSSYIAVQGEDAMKKNLASKSLGREFFLANNEEILETWKIGNNIAKEYLK